MRMKTTDPTVAAALSPYLRRERIQGLILAGAWGVSGGMAAMFLYILMRHLFFDAKPQPIVLGACFAGTALAVGFAVYFFFARPDAKTTAARLDSFGLEERVSTMLAFAGEEGYIYQLQRQDAVSHLKDVSPKQIRLRFPGVPVTAACALLALALAASFLPYGILRQSAAPLSEAELEQQTEIQQMISRMQQSVLSSELSPEQKEKMLEQLSQLSEQLDGSISPIWAMAKLQQAQQEIDLEAERLEEYGSVIRRMLRYSIFQNLCDGILQRDDLAVRRTCDALADKLIALPDESRSGALTDLFNDLQALLLSVQDTDADLYLADILRLLAVDLINAAAPEEDEDQQELIAEAFDQMADAICDRLAASQNAEEKPDSPEGKLEKGEKGSPGDSGSAGKTSSESLGGYASYGTEGVTGISITGNAVTAATELMYEPRLDDGAGADNAGITPYGSVYGHYFANMLESLTEGDSIPEDVRDTLNRYFSQI